MRSSKLPAAIVAAPRRILSPRCFGAISLRHLGQLAHPNIWRSRHPYVILVATRPHPWYEYAAAATAGSVIGAYITFRLGRRAGTHYLDGRLGKRKVSQLLAFFERWGTAALIGATAVPLPLPTSLVFAAAGASPHYSSRKYLAVVAISRAARYSAVALIARVYGRHVIRILRHPAQNWHWLVLLGCLFLAVVILAIVVSRRLAQTETEVAAARG